MKKKKKGRKPASPMLRSKLLIISGTNGPSMLVRKEMTENIKKIRITMSVFCFISILAD